MTQTHKTEISERNRFQFGSNWDSFLGLLDESRIAEAESSLRKNAGITAFTGVRFLDAGSGSGLFSLAARRLGASVHSFDFDAESVACTNQLKQRFYAGDSAWEVQEASVLDGAYMNRIGKFDLVYSWGVLHHTGAMWDGLHNVSQCVAEGGKLFIAIYNDQGWVSRYWKMVKRLYVRQPLLRGLLLAIHAPYLIGLRYLLRKIRGRPLERGMSLWHDTVDWIGGLPFEVARPEEILDFYRTRGFSLIRLKTCGGRHGCNEYVFARNRLDVLPSGQDLIA